MYNKHILLVDDEIDTLDVMKAVLETEGYKVYTASDGEKALELLEKEEFHLIITDLRMPNINGLELLKQIHKYSPNLPVLVMTAYSELESAIEIMREGAYHYISKPINYNEMKSLLAKALENNINLNQINLWQHHWGLPDGLEDLINNSSYFKNIIQLIQTAAHNNLPVLIQGEKGTYKEIIAHLIHYYSSQSKEPFLSELPNLPLHKIKGLLYIKNLQPETFQKTNSLIRSLFLQTEDFNGRIVGDTTFSPDKLFPEELQDSLNIIHISLKPLRSHIEDLPALIMYILKMLNDKYSKNIKGLAPEVMKRLLKYSWDGNIMQLLDVLELDYQNAEGTYIQLIDLPSLS